MKRKLAAILKSVIYDLELITNALKNKKAHALKVSKLNWIIGVLSGIVYYLKATQGDGNEI